MTIHNYTCLRAYGEGEIPASLKDQIEKDNIETNTCLLKVDAIPEEADVKIYAPESDISEEEKKMLADYVKMVES